MTTIDNITVSQIRTLKREAAQAGDIAMVTTCEQALEGAYLARLVCASAIADAEARSDED